MTSTTSPPSTGLKRAYQPENLNISQPPQDPATDSKPSPQTSSSASSAFRNVSACNRCRIRKNRCDQRLPACSTCEKANVRCVGYDPITKREIPRSYVYFLETRIAYFESLLNKNDIPFDPAEVFNADSRELGNGVTSPTSVKNSWQGAASPHDPSSHAGKPEDWEKKQDDAQKLEKLVSNIGMVSVQGASDARYLGSTSGISFARVVLAAVKSSVSTNNSERAGPKSSKPLPLVAASGGSSMRDSYFGLQTKPSIKEAPFPDRKLGEKLVHLYFEHANPQIPILHRGEFMELFDRVYTVEASKRTSRELYLCNIVFAVGAGIIWGSSDPGPDPVQQSDYAIKKPRLANQQAQPEEYHASAIVHLGTFLSSPADGGEKPGGDLEELQAVLLLAAFALLRPVAPGLWYIVGVAMRLAVDLGLHYEDGTGLQETVDSSGLRQESARSIDPREKGRREWTRDLRRRLWWCTYNFDRLVSTCVGRPFGITDAVVTTQFPSLLDDKYITRSGFLHQRFDDEPSYKRVAHHYIRLRLLQSEILQVLQYQQAQQVRVNGTQLNEYMHNDLPSPFLSQFNSFKEWRMDIDQRLYEWKESAPHQRETGVGFSTQFLELNYWQAVIMLYRQSLSVPAPLASEVSPTEEVSSPASTRVEDKEDEDRVFLKCAEAGQKTLKLYRVLHRLRLVNYTYLATHHLFMAGISFLYAVWHSPAVRSRLTLDDFDFTVLAATSVLGDLMEKCPPAEACRDAFERMSKATVQMCMSTSGGFGLSREQEVQRPHPQQTPRHPSGPQPMVLDDTKGDIKQEYQQLAPKPKKPKRPPPQFDMDLRGLFPDDVEPGSRPSQSFPSGLLNFQRLQQQQQFQPTFIQPQRPSTSSIASQLNTTLGMGHSPSVSSAITTNTNSTPFPTRLQPHHLQQQQQQPLYMQNTYNPDFMTVPAMDFLNNLSLNFPPSNTNLNGVPTSPHSQSHLSPQGQVHHPSPTIAAVGPVNTANTAAAPMNPSPTPQNPVSTVSPEDFTFDSSGLDLGFGMGAGGLDFQHDWSDGVQFDLFDGFFFGNN